MGLLKSRIVCLCCLLASIMLVSGREDYGFASQECPDQIDPSLFLSSHKVPLGSPDRAYYTVPDGIILQPSSIPGSGLGVFSERFIPHNTWLGEFEGDIVPLEEADDDPYMSLEYSWLVNKYDYSTDSYFIIADEVESSNWLRFLNCPRTVAEDNVEVHFCYGRVFFRTSKDVLPGQELMVYYGDDYAEEINIDTSKF